MQDRSLDRLFDRFRRQGDAAALGEVFDRTSGELLRVAMFLTRDASEAEDLLQSTFLSAIERADRYDGSRSLVPWMLGILVNHAREQRRRGSRVPDPERLGEPAVADPHGVLEELELTEEVRRALETLSARDRELLEATLRQGVAPIDFARQRGLAPGTVRMQLHRGIERLRRALPAGLALGGAAILGGGRGSAQVRAKVLDVARRAHPALAPSVGLVSALTLGGMIVSKNLALLALSLALVAGLLWVTGREPSGERSSATPGPRATLAAATPLERPGQLEPAGKAPSAAREIAREALVEPSRAEPDEAYAAALSGVSGRLVEPDGSPSAGQELVLVDLCLDDLRRLVSRPTRVPANPEIVVDRAVTGADGRFVLHGARPSTLHGLSGTARSPRVPLRAIGEGLLPGQVRDLGDIRLPPRGALAGRVTDEEGRPLVGARVRLGPIPEAPLELGAADLRPDSLLFLGSPESPTVLPIPGWAAALEEHLGLARATTDREGRFAFSDVAVGNQVLVVDREGYQGTFRDVVVRPAAAPELQLGLQRGQRIGGRVLDASGRPLAGVEVLVGGASKEHPVSVLQRAGRTSADGRFDLTGLPAGRGIALARLHPLAPWSVAVGEEGADEIDIRLPEQGALRLQIRDEHGLAIRGPEVDLVPSPPQLDALNGLIPVPDFQQRMEWLEDGLRVTGLAHGTYGVTVRAAGHATSFRPVVVDGPETVAEIRLVAAPAVAVHVRDAETGADVTQARVSLLRRAGEGVVQDSARTDPQGRCRLRPLQSGGGGSVSWFLRVEHPAYATALCEVPVGSTDSEVRLGHGGRLQVFTRAGARGVEDGLLVLTRRDAGDEDLHLLRLDAAGQGRLAQLSAGTWNYDLVAGWGRDASALGLLREAPDAVDTGTFEITEGLTTELVLDGEAPAEVDLAAGTALIEGTLRIGGRPARGCLISVQGPAIADPRPLDVAADGSFRFDNVPVDAHVLVVQSPMEELPGYFGWHSLNGLREGEQRRVELDWDLEQGAVLVVGAGGRPVRDVEVRVQGTSASSQATTDAAGRCVLTFVGPGPYRIVAHHPEQGAGRALVDQAEAEVRIVLDAGIPCAGAVRVPGNASGRATLMIHGQDAVSQQLDLTFEDGQADFRLSGMEPGDYVLDLRGLEREWTPQPLVLGPRGDGSLALVFTPQETATPEPR